jgi:branched-chain amino acid transport system ATP-binding protein
MTPALSAHGLRKRFGGLVALDGCDVQAHAGEVLGIIGVNGAGKTTLMNCVCGLYRLDAGQVAIDGKSATGLPPHAIAKLGVGRTFQVPRVFRKMSLIDNLLVPVLGEPRPNADLTARAESLLSRMQLIGLRHNYAEELSGGQQKLLELARMLMPDPKVVLLDEPFAGVHPLLCRFIIEQIAEMAHAGKSVVLISHDLTSIYRLSDRVIAMHEGRVIAEGRVDEIRASAAVVEAYLGSSAAASSGEGR